MHSRVPRRGVTMVEYALMLMLISLTSLLVVSALGTRVATTYDAAQQPITTVTAVGPTPPSFDGIGGVTNPPGGGGTTASKGPNGNKGNNGKNGNNSNNGNNGRHGNPGAGNNGNDKSVGNSQSNGGNKKP